jgi:amino acid adenylation domain-containing protein
VSYSNVLHRFLRAAEAHGPAVAVECEEARLTYAELDERSGRLARRLAALGAPAGAPVAVLGENTAQTVVAMLAVFKAGCAFVPLSPGLPRARLKAIFDVARPGWMIAGEGLLGHVAEVFPSVPRVVAVDAAGRLGDDEPGDDGAAPERAPGGPDDMAYVYFTSGSTGRPRGIAGRHKGLDHFVDWEIRALGLGPGTRVSQLTTPTHDPFLRDVWVPLCAGGTVCAPAPGTVLDARALVDWIDAGGLHVVHCIPSLFRLLLEGGIAPGRFAALRWVLLAGEPLLPADVRRWTEVFGERIGLVNLYGPTETTLAKFAHFVRSGDALRRTVPIGKPIEGAAAVVLDARGKPAPRGTVGEIYIRTPYRSLGYLGDPARTAEAFVANPLGGRADDVVYRTGDFGRVLDDGSFEFAGRRDQQVKIRGIRVELAEVEGALRAHPAVRDVAVADREHADGTRYLCAWLVVEGEPGLEALRAFAAAALSDELVPSAFVTLPALPRTATGKVDRAALPAPGGAGDARAFVAPCTPAEEALAAIWREVLEVERVGAHDNFFRLGGHSLLATRVVARVRDAFGVELPLRALFEAPTVAAFAERVESLAGAGGDGGARPIPRAPRDRPLPLSFGQQRLWFIHQLDPASPSYNLPRAIRLRGPLDDGALERTVAEVVRRHEALRTTFRLTDDGRPVQVVEPHGSFALARVSLEGVEGAAREARVRRVAAEEAERPFDLARGPLVRGTLVRLDEADHVLLLTLHHIAGDAWSMEVLAREASELYGALSGGRPSPLPPLPLQYADYAVWQRGWLRGEALERELEYWKARLAGAPELLELPTDRPRPAVASRRGASRGFRVGAGLAGALQALAQREGCTLFMVLLAGWQALLGRYAGQDDVVVGTTVANRTRREVEELVGPFLNVLALRGELAGDPTFRELLARVRHSTLGAFEHQAVPFDKVVEAVRPGRSLSHEPVFQVLFELHSGGRSGAFVEEPGAERAAGPEPAPESEAEAEAGAAMYDLSLTLFEHHSGVAGGLQYATDLFDRDTAARMLEHFRALLESAAADPDARLSELGLLGEGERARVVEEWNRTAHAYPHACIHELFEAQVRRSPGAVAVVFGGGTLTYAELDARANRLARHLRGRGIGPEDRVGLCLERGFDLMAAFFGILKAGAAYLPLDPSHPADRLGYMLADGGARLLLSQSWLADRLPGERPETIFLDEAAEAIARESSGPVESGVRPENLAYVYYTSGSTGRPKGVAMHHYGPANYFAWGCEAYRPADGHGAPVFSSMAVDLTLANFVPLFAGERVELLPEGPGVETLAQAVRRSPGFGMIKITPSHLALLNQGLTAEEAAAGTRTLVIGADNLLAEPTLLWQDHAPGVRLLNEYGPTETVVGCSLYELGAGKHREGRIPIGRPIWNLTMYVLDAHLRPVPVGLPGELYIGGVGVARGYLGRPALTAEKFVPDPFASTAGARLYRTGDRARFLADGNVEFLGRVDFQVKIRGYRIETGEIESLLSAHPAVRAALVMAREDAPGDRRLVAYLVTDGETTPAELRAALGGKLPDYMVPSAFVFLDELPVGSTGKVDRRALPAPAAGAREGDGYAAPETAAERALVEVWEEVLAVKPVGVDDDFFALGGHSMLAVRLMSQLRRRLGAELPLSALFERPTVRRLAALLDGAPGRPAWSPLVPIHPAGDRVPLFFVHPIGGQVLCYAELARALGPDQPFYGLQAPDLTAVGDAETTLEEMAASYVEAIRGVWPSGPYLLGGWSFGGLVAFEMAQQLASAGEKVPLVAILDTAAPKHARDVATVDEAELLAVLAHEEALQAGRPLSLTVDELRPLDHAARVARALDALRQAGVAAADEVDAEWVHRLLAGHRSRREAMVRYTPRVYAGRLALFLPSEAMSGFESRRGWSDPDAWRPYTTEPLLVQPVPGHHATMGTGRSAEVLARRLRAAIDEALSS